MSNESWTEFLRFFDQIRKVMASEKLRLFELAPLLVRFDQVARVNRKRGSLHHVSGYRTSRSVADCVRLTRITGCPARLAQ
jgi:hypothetical protein